MQQVFLVSHIREPDGEAVVGIAASAEAGQKLGEASVCARFLGEWERDEEGDHCRQTSVGWLWVTGYEVFET